MEPVNIMEWDLCRSFNHTVEKYAKKFKYFYVHNIKEIYTTDKSMYDIRTYSLSYREFNIFWSSVEGAVKNLDEGHLQQMSQTYKKPAYKYMNNISKENEYFAREIKSAAKKHNMFRDRQPSHDNNWNSYY